MRLLCVNKVRLILLLDFLFTLYRRKDGKEYTPDTLYQLYNGLWHVLLRDRKVDIWKDEEFDPCRKSLDFGMRRLTALGVGDEKSRPEVSLFLLSVVFSLISAGI